MPVLLPAFLIRREKTMKTFHNLTAAPTSPATNDVILYAKGDDLYAINSSGTVIPVAPGSPVAGPVDTTDKTFIDHPGGPFLSMPIQFDFQGNMQASDNLTYTQVNNSFCAVNIGLGTTGGSAFVNMYGGHSISGGLGLEIYGAGTDPTNGGLLLRGSNQIILDLIGGNLHVRTHSHVDGLVFNGATSQLSLVTSGAGLSIRETTGNAKQGKVTLVAGTATISNTAVTAVSRIFLTNQTGGTAPGTLYVSARNPGVDFTITSTSSTDDADVAYFITEPA